MKRSIYLQFFLLMLTALPSAAQNDVIMLRDGREKHVKITQVGRRQTFFKDQDDKKAEEKVINNDAVYMLKYENRGNAYFDESGQLLTATTEPVVIPEDACTIYTLDRREIPAWNVAIREYKITYEAARPSKKRKRKDYHVPTASSVPKVDVFFIRYPDGTRDVINEFTEPTVETSVVQQPAEAIAEQQSEPEESETTNTTSREYPCSATIITKKKAKMNVYIYAEDSTTVSYRKEKSEKASIFKISRKNIANIKY